MELIDRIKIKRSDDVFFKTLIIIIYPFLLIFGLVIMLFAAIISLFQRKEVKIIVEDLKAPFDNLNLQGLQACPLSPKVFLLPK